MEGSYVYIVAVLMGGSNTEAATTGLYIFNGLADLVNCPISGKYHYPRAPTLLLFENQRIV